MVREAGKIQSNVCEHNLCFLIYLFIYLEMVSLYSFVCPGTWYVVQADLKLRACPAS